MAEWLEDLGSTENVVKHIEEHRDDIESVVIPQSPSLLVTINGQQHNVAVGMIVHLLKGDKLLMPAAAEAVLNNGVLTRMRIPIKLENPAVS
jgi:hypothetical protein